ncbi:MAG: BspA family leucine-rich repeat surface protein [Prevotella sp.]|nr:BspA family leucine-rich repeat surface protein [Prevotella sp.]
MMKTKHVLLTFVLLLSASTGFAWDGRGTETEPYLITSTDDLIQLANDVNGGTKYKDTFFRLAEDLIFTGKDFTPIGNEGDDPESLEDNKPFMGTFDGYNHTISGIKVGNAQNSNIAIFGYIYGATIMNLTVTNSSFIGDYGVGAIVGAQDQGTGTIENCHVADNVTINGVNAVGGIAGTLSYMTVKDCSSAATVKRASGEETSIGAIVGSIYDCSLENNYYYPLNVEGGKAYEDDPGDNSGAKPCYMITAEEGFTFASPETPSFSSNDINYYAVGTTITLPGDGTDYTVKDKDGNEITVSDGRFTMPEKDVTITKANTEPVAYGTVTNGVLTLRYDKNIPTPTTDAPVYDIPWSEDEPGWYNHNSGVTRVVIDPSFKDFNGLEDADYMFSDLQEVTEISGLEYFNTTNVKSMSYMFQNCKALTTLDLSKFNTSNVEGMDFMFDSCEKLTSIDVSSFNTSKVLSMEHMFYNCKALKTIDLNSFDVRKVTSDNGMDDMFTGCTALTTIYCDNSWTDLFTEDNYEWLGDLFTDCTSLKGAVAYDENKTDITMANPTTGYFTGKQVEYITFYDKQDNTELLRKYNGQTINMKIEGRTFYKDDDWNTLVLPFDLVTYDDNPTIQNFLKGATIKTPQKASFNEANHTLTIAYSKIWPLEEGEGGSYVASGIPFIVKWEATNEHDTNPTFEDVQISINVQDDSEPDKLEGGILNVVNTFKPITITGEDKTKLFMGANGKFYYPDGKKPTNINAFRFYFQLADGYELGDKTTTAGAKSISNILLDFGDDTPTAIIAVDSDQSLQGDKTQWYLLDGRRLTGKPTRAGIYIVNGKKVVIK